MSAQSDPLSLREKLLNAAGSAIAILALGLFLGLVSREDFVLPVMTSLGASAFLLFVVPHSPMSQPVPLIGGHAIAALIAVAFVYLLDYPALAAAASVGATILAMQLLRCLHPPAAATALAVPLGGIQGAGGILTLACAVIAGTLVLVVTAIAINRMLLGRRYPLSHSHHPHHARFQETHARDPLRIEEQDIEWALRQMDGIVDATQEDLIDVYELAMEHALARRAGSGQDGGAQAARRRTG